MQKTKFILRTGILCLVALAAADGASIAPSQTGPATWVYDLTFDPLDNYSIFQPVTTITFTGLFGVTSASGPVSTDFDEPLNTTNLDWSVQVLNGGTTVVWSHVGSGTGNFGNPKHIYGFTIHAPGAVNGVVNYETSGISRDTGNPLPGGGFDLDISGSIAGPVANANIPEPGTLPLIALGLGCAAAIWPRRTVGRD